MKILYFAWLRTRIGLGEEELAAPQTVTTVAGLIAWLATRSEGHAHAFAEAKLIRCAVNQDFALPDTAIGPQDEIAFFPPVTGG
jgi:molybdopterin converting factor subunit 1